MTNTNTRKLIYLAAPYTNADQEIQELNFESANEVAAQIAIQFPRVCPYSPISHGCAIATHLKGDESHEWWMQMCWPFLEASTAIWVSCVTSRWRDSKGVRMEIERAKQLGMPIWYVTRDNPRNARMTISVAPPK